MPLKGVIVISYLRIYAAIKYNSINHIKLFIRRVAVVNLFTTLNITKPPSMPKACAFCPILFIALFKSGDTTISKIYVVINQYFENVIGNKLRKNSFIVKSPNLGFAYLKIK